MQKGAQHGLGESVSKFEQHGKVTPELESGEAERRRSGEAQIDKFADGRNG